MEKLREDFFPAKSLQEACLDALEKMLSGLDSGKVRLRIPGRRGLYRKLPESHFHATLEVFVQLSGVTRFAFPEEKMSLFGDEVCIIPRGLPHAEKAENYRGDFLNLVMVVRKDCLYYHFAVKGDENRPRGLMDAIGRCRATARLNEYCEAAVRASEDGSEAGKLTLKGLALACLGTAHGIVSGRAEPAGPESAKIRQCRDIVNMQMSKPDLNVRMIASWMRCSADYLSHLFRRETGISLVDYINRLRVEQARELLQDNTLNVSEIAWSCGYTDPGYFSRVFRKFTGQSPRLYRRNLEQ